MLFFTFSFPTCKTEEDEPDLEEIPEYEIYAGISEDCNPYQNFSNDYVFAESVMIDGIKRFLVGGNSFNRELGFILPWPPVIGVYTLGGNSWAYYDPYVNENDTSNYLDQYATNYIEGTEISIEHIVVENEIITGLDILFDSVRVVNSEHEYLCLAMGRIRIW